MFDLTMTNVQIGNNATAENNFHLKAASDSSFSLSQGNVSAPIKDLIKITDTDVTLLDPKNEQSLQLDDPDDLITTQWIRDKDNLKRLFLNSGVQVKSFVSKMFMFVADGTIAATGPSDTVLLANKTGGFVLAYTNSIDDSSFGTSVVVGEISQYGQWSKWLDIPAKGPVCLDLSPIDDTSYLLAFANYENDVTLGNSIKIGRVTSTGYTQWASVAANRCKDISLHKVNSNLFRILFSNSYDSVNLNNQSVVLGEITSSGYTQKITIPAKGPVGVELSQINNNTFIAFCNKIDDASNENLTVTVGEYKNNSFVQWAAIASVGAYSVSMDVNDYAINSSSNNTTYVIAFANYSDVDENGYQSVVVGEVKSTGFTQWAKIPCKKPTSVKILHDGNNEYVIAIANSTSNIITIGRVSSIAYKELLYTNAFRPTAISLVQLKYNEYMLSFTNSYSSNTYKNKHISVFKIIL